MIMMAYPDYNTCTCTSTCTCDFSCYNCSFNRRRSNTSHFIIITDTRSMYKSDEELEAFIKALKKQTNYIKSMCMIQLLKEIHAARPVQVPRQLPSKKFLLKGARR